MKTWGNDAGYVMPHALWANDPRNRENISLQNILQNELVKPDGSVSHLPFQGTLAAAKPSLASGSYRFPMDPPKDPKVKELWWAVERGEPGALKALIGAAARKGPQQAELTSVLDAVKAAVAKRQEELVAAPVSMETYEGLESLIQGAEGLDVKAAQARLRELRSAKEMKDELRARDLYLQCQQQALSPKPDVAKAAKGNFAALASKMPDTVYGKKAAAAAK